MAKNIVVGYDGSDASRRALDRAADFARNGANVTVVTVAPSVYPYPHDSVPDPARVEQAERLLAEARARLAARQVSARTLEPVGDPAETLVETARELRADLVVVGQHGRNALERLVLGSVSTKVVHEAPCDVLVVR